jgi:hypothetical protein
VRHDDVMPLIHDDVMPWDVWPIRAWAGTQRAARRAYVLGGRGDDVLLELVGDLNVQVHEALGRLATRRQVRLGRVPEQVLQRCGRGTSIQWHRNTEMTIFKKPAA